MRHRLTARVLRAQMTEVLSLCNLVCITPVLGKGNGVVARVNLKPSTFGLVECVPRLTQQTELTLRRAWLTGRFCIWRRYKGDLYRDECDESAANKELPVLKAGDPGEKYAIEHAHSNVIFVAYDRGFHAENKEPEGRERYVGDIARSVNEPSPGVRRTWSCHVWMFGRWSAHTYPVSAQQRANAVFESHAADGKVWLRLTKAVHAGEEITAKYGPNYPRNYATA